MFEALNNISRNRGLLLATVLQALRARFIGNSLGAAWLLLYPLMFLTIYAVVFMFILGIRIPGLGTADYVLTIFCGLVPFLAFSEAFGVGTVSIVSNRSLLRNTLFPIELVVARDVIVGHVMMGFGMLLVWIVSIYQGHIHLTHLMIPIIYVLQIMMALGIIWITSTLTVFFRDFQQAVPILILFLMLISPIGYAESMVPDNMKAMLIFNPLAWLMKLYRACFLEGVFPVQDFIILSIFSIIIFVLGYKFISRLKSVCVDYV